MVWEYYEKFSNRSIAKCILCNKEYSYKTSVTNLKKHLMHKHSSAFRKFLNRQRSSKGDSVSQYLQQSAVKPEIIEGPESPCSSQPGSPEQYMILLCEPEPESGNTSDHQIVPPPVMIHARPQKSKQHQLWDLYEKIPEIKAAKCLLCHKEYSFRTGITNLRKHLEYKHYSTYCNLVNQEDNCASMIDSKDTLESPQFSDVEQEIEEPNSPQPDSDFQTKPPFSIHQTPQKKNPYLIWEYYVKIPGATVAKCSLCHNEYSYKTSITNLKMHLKIKHKSAYDLLSQVDSCTYTVNRKDTLQNQLHSDVEQKQGQSDSSQQCELPFLRHARPLKRTWHKIWEYYEKKPGSTEAKCLLCQKKYSYKTSVTNLKTHLQLKHTSVYDLLNQEDGCTNTADSKNTHQNLHQSDEEQDTEGLSSLQTESDFQSKPESISLPSRRKYKYMNEKKNITVNPSGSNQRKKQIDKKLLEMIIKDYQPFTVVEDQGFRSFVKALNPNYMIPNRKLISRSLIPEQFTKCKMLVMNMVQNVENVCLTVDHWTSLKMDSYVTVTAHFMMDFELKNVLLHCELLSSSQTAVALATSLKNITQEFKIEDKITLAVSDNSPYIKNAIEMNQWPFFSCLLNKLNLVIGKAIGVLDNILENVKTVVVHFKSSNDAMEALVNYQTDFDETSLALQLIQSVPNRWNSIFYMLQRFLKLQSTLEAVMPNLTDDLPVITIEIWDTIKQVCMILQPFEEVSKVMCAEQYLTASLAIVIVDGLKNVINLMKHKPMFGVAKTFIGKLDDGLRTYFPESEIEDNMLLGVCTFIDPRFKIHAFLDHQVAEDSPSEETCKRTRRANLIEHHILELIKYKIREKQQSMPSTVGATPCMPHTTTSILDNQDDSISIWGKIDKSIAAITPSDDITTIARNELDLFLNEEVVRRDSCPLHWWKKHAVRYPNLVDIFIEHCHIVVTSVPCDTIFSKAGNILTQKRAHLSRKRTSELVFLNRNMPCVNRYKSTKY